MTAPDRIEAAKDAIAEQGADALEGLEVPIVEDGRALFVYEGRAEGVWLHHWIFGLESAQEFLRTHPDVWTPSSRSSARLAWSTSSRSSRTASVS